MISLRDVSVVFTRRGEDPVRALDALCLEIERGAWIALAGGNGSGKSTLLRLLAGVIAPTSGEITYAGGTRPRTAMLLQEPDNQFVTTSVLHELMLSVEDDSDANRERVDDAIDRFSLGDLLSRNPHELSGGEKQRLALATVWLHDPLLLLLDEPTSFLDAAMARDSVALIQELHTAGTAVVWATPGGAELTCAHEVVCLHEGRVGFRGSEAQLHGWADDNGVAIERAPVRALADALLPALTSLDAGLRVARRRHTRVEPLPDVAALADVIARSATVRDGTADGSEEKPPARTGAPEAIRFDSVAFGYHNVDVFDGIDITVRAGECVGIAGANASGKSTLLQMAAGVLAPRAGRVMRADLKVFFMPQSPERLFFAETVEEELAFGMKRMGMSADEIEEGICAALDVTGLPADRFRRRFPFQLSLGEMRRVAFAIAAALRPELLLLDEPTSCMDRDGIDKLRNLVGHERERGATLLITSHDVSVLCELCDRVVVLGGGRSIADIDTSDDTMHSGDAWPADRSPLLVELQDALAERGLIVDPRALTADALARLLERCP